MRLLCRFGIKPAYRAKLANQMLEYKYRKIKTLFERARGLACFCSESHRPYFYRFHVVAVNRSQPATRTQTVQSLAQASRKCNAHKRR